MKLSCIDVEDMIWNSARANQQMPVEIMSHIENCKECAQAAKDVGISLKVLGDAEHYPAVPDCRQKVMMQLETARPFGLTRLYVLAAVPAALAIVLVAALYSKPHQPVDVHRPVKHARVERKLAGKTAKITPGVADYPSLRKHYKQELAKVTNPPAVAQWHETAVHNGPAIHKRIRTASAAKTTNHHYKHLAKLNTTKPVVDQSAKRQLNRFYVNNEQSPVLQEHVVRAVSVDWSAEPVGDVSYQYSETDKITGTVTVGSVERTGDSIEIRVESVPASSTSEPVKGMIEHEKKPSA